MRSKPKQSAVLKRGLDRDRKKLETMRQSDPEIAEAMEQMIANAESIMAQLETDDKRQTNNQQKAESNKPKKTRTEKPTESKSRTKPNNSYEGFSLFSHLSEMWAIKIRGSLFWFVWDRSETIRTVPLLSKSSIGTGRF